MSGSMKLTEKQKAIACIIASAFFFALMNLFVRLSGDLPSVQKAFFRNFVAFFFALVMIIKSGEGFHIQKRNIKWHLARSASGTIGVLCNFYAVDHLLLSDASILNKLSPFFAIIFSSMVLSEKPSRKQTIAIIIAFVGALLVVKPGFAMADALGPALIAVMGGMGAGFAYTMVRKLGMRGEKGPVIVMFFSGFSCLVLLPFLIFDYHSMTVLQVVILLCAGLSAAGGQFTITAAYTHAPAKEVSIYDYTQILFAAGLGLIFFGQIPDIFSLIGYIIIIGVAIYHSRSDSGSTEKLEAK